MDNGGQHTSHRLLSVVCTQRQGLVMSLCTLEDGEINIPSHYSVHQGCRSRLVESGNKLRFRFIFFVCEYDVCVC